MSKLETIPQYFLDRAKNHGTSKVAMRQKEFGVWHEYTWLDSYEAVRDFATPLQHVNRFGSFTNYHLCCHSNEIVTQSLRNKRKRS